MMQLDLASLWAEVRISLTDPRKGARRVIALNLPTQTAALALVIVAILSAFKAFLGQALGLAGLQGDLAFSPFALAVGQIGSMFLFAAIVYFVGRLFGGQGSWSSTLGLMAWAHLIMLVFDIAQILVLLIFSSTDFGLLIMFIWAIFLLWVLSNFIGELHGFSSFKVAAVIIAISFAFVLILMQAKLGG